MAWGGESVLLTLGGKGAILSPIFALVWSILDGMFGRIGPQCLHRCYVCMVPWAYCVRLGRQKNGRIYPLDVWFRHFCVSVIFVYTGRNGVVGVAIIPLLLCWYVVERFRLDKRIFGLD